MTVEPLPLKAIHHVEILAGNAKQAAFFYRKAFGFSQIAYAGPETGVKEQASYVLNQGRVNFVVSTPLTPEDSMSDNLKNHGDGVLDIAFIVDDVDSCCEEARSRGAKIAREPFDMIDENGRVRRAKIQAYGDTYHSLISLADYNGPFLPGYRTQRLPESGVGLMTVDHVVANVEDGCMDSWEEYYQNVFGFHRFLSFDDKDISTEHTALRSKVMSDPSNGLHIKFPINEPAEGKRKSQIQEYIDFNRGAGVQHVALTTGDIIHTISLLRARGVEFLGVPDTYYDIVWDRVGDIREDKQAIKDLNILIDCDDKGYLLQIFTQPVEDRPTLFYEIIQRRGSDSFGKGNFRALFESIERAQDERGNL